VEINGQYRPKDRAIRINRADQIDFPFARPMLDVFLALDRTNGRGVLLVIDEHFHAMLFGEAVGQAFAMLIEATNKIIRHSHVERAAWAALQNIDPIASHSAVQHGLPGQARQ
jgi:hypothetical protein